MRYLMLINTVEAEDAKATAEEGAATFAEYAQLMEELGAQGKVLAGERLRPTSTATTIRVLDGEVLTTDVNQPNMDVVPLRTNGLEVRTASGQTSPELLGWRVFHEGGQKPVRTTTVLHTRKGAGVQSFLTRSVRHS